MASNFNEQDEVGSTSGCLILGIINNMIVKPELVRKIKDYFGLNIYETKVWLALIGKGIASAGEIAELSGVPRSRTYDVLESLEKQGFAIIKIGKPVKYIAVKPTSIIEKLKTNALKQAEEKVFSLSNLKSTQEYLELESLHKSGLKPIKQSDLSGAIRGKTNIYTKIREMLENSEKEILICSSAKELENKSRVFSGLFDRLQKAGIKIEVALNSTDEEIAKLNKRFNIKAKKIAIKSRFFISDNKELLFMVSEADKEEDLGIWLNSEFFAAALSDMLELALRNSK